MNIDFLFYNTVILGQNMRSKFLSQNFNSNTELHFLDDKVFQIVDDFNCSVYHVALQRAAIYFKAQKLESYWRLLYEFSSRQTIFVLEDTIVLMHREMKQYWAIQ